QIQPEGAPEISRADVDPIAPDEYWSLWEVPTIKAYARSEVEQAIVLAPSGPVLFDETTVYLDGDWRRAGVIQQREGVAQLLGSSLTGLPIRSVGIPASFAA